MSGTRSKTWPKS